MRFTCHIDGLDVFLPFPHWAVPAERTVISVTVNTVRFLATVPILMNCCAIFGTGKLSLTGHSVVYVLLALETPQWIRDVGINLYPKESNFYRSGKYWVSKRENDGAGI